MTHTATATVTELPVPSSRHATCAWCRQRFDTITELLDHADGDHFDAESTSSSLRPADRMTAATSSPRRRTSRSATPTTWPPRTAVHPISPRELALLVAPEPPTNDERKGQ